MSNPLANLHREEITVNTLKANVFVIIFSIPLALVLGGLFYLFWHDLFTTASIRLYLEFNIKWLQRWLLFLLFVPLIVGAVLHELIHGLTWACYATQGLRSIRFGITWKMLTPYCHCKEPLRMHAYRLGVVMPGIVLGLLPQLYAFVTGNIGVFVFGFVFTVAAGGDFLMLWMLRKEKGESWVEDHQEKIGCVVYRD
jgi:hypothetical protein